MHDACYHVDHVHMCGGSEENILMLNMQLKIMVKLYTYVVTIQSEKNMIVNENLYSVITN